MRRAKAGRKLVKSLRIVHDTFKKQLHGWHKSCRSHCWPEHKRACRQSGLQPPECLDTPCPCSFSPYGTCVETLPGSPKPVLPLLFSQVAPGQVTVTCPACFYLLLPYIWIEGKHVFKKKKKKEVRGGKAERPQGWAVHLTNSLGG